MQQGVKSHRRAGRCTDLVACYGIDDFTTTTLWQDPLNFRQYSDKSRQEKSQQRYKLLTMAMVAGPLVDLLKYKAEESHWPLELREKTSITVQAEAALAIASLCANNDNMKDVIGAAGAIPLLCDLIW
uniref:Uncharacterized protein n=1 Tax=Physcomitrium patens TaxID=3218 RepID=A0A2K1IUP8_PHYPA|nr:hypothetical protein PHYPA_024945 [Physcomitrium patens]